jgi:hypothetical protein
LSKGFTALNILNPRSSILNLPHLFPDYPELKISARAPGTWPPRNFGSRATVSILPQAHGEHPLTHLQGQFRLLRGNIRYRSTKSGQWLAPGVNT